jgi:hypothetical protein
MAETFIQLPSDTDNTGKQVANYIDASGFYRQVTIWGDSSSSGVIVAAVKAPNVSPATAVDGAGTVVLRPDSISNDGGTPINGATIPTGGLGLTGWMSASWSVLTAILTKLNGSLAVTGTFFQATQPVSIASSVPVTGTFWQTTQPVSISTTITIAGGNKPVGPASISAVQSPVGTSAAAIIAARTGGVGTGRCTVTLKNMGPAAIAIGQSIGVTTSTGFILNPGDSASFDTDAAIYGVSTADGNNVCVMETY